MSRTTPAFRPQNQRPGRTEFSTSFARQTVGGQQPFASRATGIDHPLSGCTRVLEVKGGGRKLSTPLTKPGPPQQADTQETLKARPHQVEDGRSQ